MGMYTELHYNVELIENVPEEVLDVLRHMLYTGEEMLPEPPLPDHALFESDRWHYMLVMDSYYFSGDTHSTLRYDDISKEYTLSIRCNLKNYDNEIEKFIDWIHPYIAKEVGDFLGFWRYEEVNTPTLIFA